MIRVLMLLAAAGALTLPAAPAAANPLDRQGFNELDRNHDGALERGEARAKADVAKRFDQADANHDGKLSRFEYLKSMTAQDLHTLREKAADIIEPDTKSAASGASK
jgi:Ca2+-binding EF-hand superfamily protein